MRIDDPETLHEEVAFVAYHFGWDREAVLTMPHWERRRWCEEISRINDRVNDGGAETGRDRRGDSGGIVLRNPIDSA